MVVPAVQVPVVTVVRSHSALVVVVLVSSESQFLPAAMQTGLYEDELDRVTQQPPLHKLPAQHGEPVEVDVPGVPQTAHRLELLQMVPAAVQVDEAQQGCPAPPHPTQVPELLLVLLHAVPGSRHVVPEVQQACPVPPHSLHTYVLEPLLLSYRHCVPASLHKLPAQQGPPDFPQVAHVELV